MLFVSDRTLAALALAGTILEALGGLYMGYDLLGGAAGPLVLVTRAVSYSLLFGVSYGLALG